MTRQISICIIIILYSLSSFSQDKKLVYYFDDKLNPVKKSRSVSTGTGTPQGNLFSLQVTDNKTDQTIMLAHYTDSSLTVRHGLFQSYFNNGRKESEGNYEHGKEDGLWKKWDNRGRLADSTIYDHGKKVNATTFRYFRKASSSYRFEDFANNKMQEVFYNDSGKVTEEANFIGNSGIRKIYDKDGVRTDSVFSRELREASYPGGEAAWARYIQEKIKENISDIIRDNQSGTCRLKFIIDKNGNVSNVEALTMKGSVLASVAKNALLSGPKWIPAVQYGRPVNAYREMPVTFTISNK